VAVDANGLMTALEDMAARTQEQFGITCRFECDHPVPIDDNATATHLFYFAQEAVHNAAKHAHPKSIVIRLEDSDGRIALNVDDDGIGIGTRNASAPSMGINIMQYRAGEIGARLGFGAGPHGGTCVSCLLPWSVRHGETERHDGA
jgi:two-component system CheB/CheR fusion protein